MNRKTKVNNNCFDFALIIESCDQISDNHLLRVYKLDSELCKSKSNKNCVQNIRCLNGLGEKSWLSLTDTSLDQFKDSELGRRTVGAFVGLKNLGATCYVNCLLQVWFHNTILRLVIYKWNPEEDEEEVAKNLLKPTDGEFMPISCIGKLQLIFALMQFGIRSSVDPKPFITCLGLDENRQQDAHEFSSLFFTLIEKKLRNQTNSELKDIIQSHYIGEYAYRTQCMTCQGVSQQESRFYELSLKIKGCKTLSESLKDYLQQEYLDGNNQYFCGNCRVKRDAVRCIQLRRLPPILNIQLLRFVFEPQIKKLNSYIQFPDVLDVKEYLPDTESSKLSPEEMTYHLNAVLIHRGPSAHSGHYIAHIKDENTGFWFKFNDEKVEEIEGKNLKLDSDDGDDDCIEINGNPSQKSDKNKEKNGLHNSNNAYMLVYKNQTLPQLNLGDSFDDWNLPLYLVKAIQRDNQSFEASVSELIKQKELETLARNKRKAEIIGIYSHLSINSDKTFEFISKKWLNDWLNAKPLEPIPPVDNNSLLCIHSKLNFRVMSSVKCISKYGANLIYGTYGGGPRLDSEFLCRTCVVKEVEFIKLKTKIDEDIKRITSQLKYSLNPSEESFWIGKDSFKSWKQIKLKSIESQSSIKNDTSDDSIEMIDNSDNQVLVFNEDIVCDHGDLSPDESKRRLIPGTVWQTLKEYFPNARQFSSESNVCQSCLILNKELETIKTLHKDMAANQKTELPNLSAERHRFLWEDLSITEKYYALSRKFLTAWKKFVNDPLRCNPPDMIDNSNLLCAHQNFLFPTHKTEITGIDSKFVIVSGEEWRSLANHYSNNSEITFYVVLDENNIKSFESNPPYCDSCFQSLILQEERDRLTYKNQSIYVIKTENNEINSDESVDKFDTSSESFQIKLNDKKIRKETAKTVLGNGEIQGLRRSSRRRKNRNEKEIKVSSNTTLLQLKVQIMNLFKVAPYDQHLSIDSRPLETNSKTLAELHVEPYSVINLKIDQEPSGECTIIDDDYIKGGLPDIGFKGTQLQNH